MSWILTQKLITLYEEWSFFLVSLSSDYCKFGSDVSITRGSTEFTKVSVMLLLSWLWKQRYPHQLALPRCSKVAFHQWSLWQLSVGRMSRHLLNSSQVMLEDARARTGPTDTFCLPGDYPNISLLSISSFFLGCVFFCFFFFFYFHPRGHFGPFPFCVVGLMPLSCLHSGSSSPSMPCHCDSLSAGTQPSTES